VHDEGGDARLGHGADEVAHEAVVLDSVDADAMLHGDRDRNDIAHRAAAITHEGRFGHQAGAESTVLHPFRGAAAVQVDLVVAPRLTEFRGMCQRGRVGAAQLQRDRVLLAMKAQMAFDIAVLQRAGRHHLGVQPGVRRQQAVEVAAVPVGPVEHRRDGEATRGQRF